MTSGTNLHSRYHPDYSPHGKSLLDFQQSLTLNAGARTPLLTIVFTEPTQEPDCSKIRTGLHQPPALYSILTRADSPSKSLK